MSERCFEEMGVQGDGKGMARDLSQSAEKANSNIDDKVYKSFCGDIYVNNIPEELRDRKQFLNWGYERHKENANEKRKKIPLGSVGKPSNWSSLEDALKFIEKDFYYGLGFVFTSGDPYTGIDLDNCRDPTTEVIEDWALDVIHSLNSYTEISPSGKGVHIIVKAKLPMEGRKKGNIEMYDSKRFFTITGNVLKYNEKEYCIIADNQDEVKKLHFNVFGSDKPTVEGNIAAVSPTLEDEKLIEMAGNAKDGEKFNSLFSGDTSGYNSHSEADQALCNILAFWTQDKAQIDRIFRQSGLIRPKWDEYHGWGTYGEMTIIKALEGVKEHYKGSQLRNKTIKAMDALIEVIDYLVNKDEDARLIYTSLDEPYLWVRIEDHFEMIKLNPKNKTFKMFLFGQVKERYGITLRDDETFKNALLAIEYTAKKITEAKGFDLYPLELGFRCTWHNDSAWIDSCGPDWTGIKINEDGFIKSDLPPIFLRTSLQKEIAEPNYQAKPEDFDKIFKYINVRYKGHRLLVKTWICAAMIPRIRNKSIAQPWLSFTGITSAGKTKAGQYAKKIVDPIKGDLNGSDKTPLPKEAKDLAVILNNSQVVLFDNTGKRINDELSDLLCIAVTRGCFRTRKLYSDDEEALLNLNSAIIMTSIANDSLNEDLLNRMIPIELKGFDKDNKRKPEIILDEAFEKDLPDILGGAYCSISKAFGNIDEIYEEVSKLEEAPRLLDFAVMGEALSRVWGENNGSFIKAYNEAQGKKSAENITASPVINSLVGYIKSLENGAKYDREKNRFDEYEPYTFYGPISKLAACLRDYYTKEDGSYPNEKMWPQTGKAFGNKIKESMMGLKNSGIDVIVDERQTSGVYYYTIKALDKINESLDKAW
jgi:primase-polymerase (primpol)-like protein